MIQLIELHRLELEAMRTKNKDLFKTLENYQRILQLKQMMNNVGGQCRTMTEIGKLYYELGDEQKCRLVHQQLTELLFNLKGSKIKIDFFGELSNFYFQIGDNETAEYYHRQMLNYR